VRLGDYCRGEPRFLLLPGEHLGPAGPDDELTAFLERDCGWSRERVELLGASLALYWNRSRDLARSTRTWPSPRLRNVGVVADGSALRPYAQVLNTSTSMLHDCDLDPALSCPELVAYLLVLGDWMSMTGEVTQAPMRSAVWWFDADDEMCRRFGEAARRSTRPDAGMLAAVADATTWLRELRHRRLRPAVGGVPHREIPGTGLQVPGELAARPPELVESCRGAAVAAVEQYRSAWRSVDPGPLTALVEWLEHAAPQLVVTTEVDTMVWDHAEPTATGALAEALADADPVAVEAIHRDLETIDARSRAFLDALCDRDALPDPDAGLEQRGYAYMHAGSRVIAYNLLERGMERLAGPPLPYERAMLGARTLHEWAHLAGEAGWVPAVVDEAELTSRRGALADALEAAVAGCAVPLRNQASDDLAEIAAGKPDGEALADLLLTRLPDYRANLIAGPFMTEAERETYVRHNVRTLRYEYPPTRLWRMIVRYLYEYQYLLPQAGLTTTKQAYAYFIAVTGFDVDVIETGALGEERFDAVTEALSSVCGAYAVDPVRITLPGS